MSRAEVESIFQKLREPRKHPPRVLFVYAHPDDEAIAVGGHLPLFRDALFLQVTDGAPADNSDGDRLGLTRDEYRATRALELRAAFAAAGLPEARHRCLNLPDKEAALHLTPLVEEIARVIATEEPAVIFTHPYEGGHADHDASAFAVHCAAASARTRALILESPFYYRNPNGSMHTGSFLHEDPNAVLTLPLSEEQAGSKCAAFSAFATQGHVLQAFQSALRCERFRVAPVYDFTRPATPQKAFYETFIPGMTAVRFAELAAQAMDAAERGKQPTNLAA